jgi:CBS domain-containing protein
MQVSEIITRDVETILPTATIREAAQRMRSMDVGSLPVCDGTRLLGMITDRDITVRAIADGRDPASTPVRDAMTPDVCYVFDDDDVQKAARLMQEKQIRRLPILNHDKKLVGIVALADVARAGDDPMSGQTLEQISDPKKQPSTPAS